MMRHGIRIGLVLSLSVGAIWLSVSNGVARTAANRKPELALQWLPMDSSANAKRAETLLRRSPRLDNLTAVESLAKAALVRDPTNVSAVRTLGVLYELRKQRKAAERLMMYSSALSRRDLPTRIWFIERAVSNGDIDQALREYDIALSASQRSQELLFPILINAAADDEIRTALTTRLSRKPPWRSAFLSQVINTSPTKAAELSLALSAAGSALSSEEKTALMWQLAQKGSYSVAGAVHSQLGPTRPSANYVLNGDFSALEAGTPFEWQYGSAYGARARVDAVGSGANPALTFDMNIDEGGELARQIVLLKPGKYSLSFHLGALQDHKPGRLRLRLACVEQSKLSLFLVEASPPASGAEKTTKAFHVPLRCPAQILQIEGVGSDELSGGWIDNLTISRH